MSEYIYDGYAVYQGMTGRAKLRTSPDNVSDVLDSLHRLEKAARQQAGPVGFRVMKPTGAAIRDGERWEIYAPGGSGGIVHEDDVTDWVVRRLLDSLATAPQAERAVEAVRRATIRDVFLRNGFTIKDGQTDLKPYVYKAAEELLALAAPPAPDVSGLVDALEMGERLISGEAVGAEWKNGCRKFIKAARAARAAHKQEGKRQHCEYAGCCNPSIGATRLCADHQEQQP